MAKANKKAKKAVKRAAPKKAVAKAGKHVPAKAKKQVYVKISTKILGEAPQEFEFYLQDGKKLKSVYELVDSLEHMNDGLFRQHVNDAKNDFSNWIKDVFEEPSLAKEIHKIQDRIEMQKLLMRKLIEAARRG